MMLKIYLKIKKINNKKEIFHNLNKICQYLLQIIKILLIKIIKNPKKKVVREEVEERNHGIKQIFQLTQIEKTF